MNTTRAWTEKVTYYECPECQETVELGSDLFFSGIMEEDCEKCGKTFTLEPPLSEDDRHRSRRNHTGQG